MSEIACTNCNAACCKGPMVVSLTLEEASFMLRGGNKLTTVAQPADYDREEVIYPLGLQQNDKNPGLRTWILEKGREYEPLAAGLGRYILEGDCAYLEVSDDGWERCSAYEQRPAVCRTFEMGSEKCQLMRGLRGVSELPDEASESRGLLKQAIENFKSSCSTAKK